jgi:hypothetical protein
MPKSNGAKPTTDGRVDVGTFRTPVQPPRNVGDITVAEQSEIKERQRLMELAQARVKTLQQELDDQQKLLIIMGGERNYRLSQMCKDHGLPPDNEYRIDPDKGVIWLTGEAVSVSGEAIEDLPVIASKE